MRFFLTVLLVLIVGSAHAQSVSSVVRTSFQPPLRIAATGGMFPDATVSTGTGTIKDTGMSRIPVIFGCDASEVRFTFEGYNLTATGYQSNTQNIAILGLGLESDALVKTAPMAWSGSPTATILIDSTQNMSDPVFPAAFGLTKFSKDTLYWVRVKAQLGVSSDTQGWPIGIQASYTGAAGIIYPRANDSQASSVYGTGTLATPSGGGQTGSGSGTTNSFGPSAVIGRCLTPGNPSVAVLGASFSTGTGDQIPTPLPTGIGMMAHAALNNGAISGTIPFTTIGHGSLGATNFVNPAQFPAKVFWPLQYANIAFVDLGANDIGPEQGPETPATVLSEQQQLWTLAKNAGALLVQMSMNQRTGSSNNWDNAAGQTYDTNFGPGSNAATLNTLLSAQLADGAVSALFNSQTGTTDPGDIWKWCSNGTDFWCTINGGDHPTGINGNTYATLGANLRTVLQSIPVSF